MGLLALHGQARAGRLILLRPFEPSDADEVLGLYVRNREFLKPYVPSQPGTYFTKSEQQGHIAAAAADRRSGRRYVFGIFLMDDGSLVGRVALDNVVRGAWKNATLGYFVDRDHNGRGIGTAAVATVLRFAFLEADLHRVQAGAMPRNVASIRVLEKCGFRFEGFSPRYLEINGVWEDHNLYAVTIEEWAERERRRSPVGPGSVESPFRSDPS